MKTVLVTGASTGIGFATALALDRDGWCVLAGARSDEAQARLRDLLSRRSAPVRLDVTRPEEIAAAVKLADARGGGRLDALVNNAGIVVTGPFEALTAEALREQFAVNVFGLAAVTQACLPLLRAAQGRIVNVGSISGRTTWPCNSFYAGSKYAVRAMTDALRIELRPFGVRVILVEPGAIATPLWDKQLPASFLRMDALEPAVRARYEAIFRTIERARAAIKRVAARPESVARVIWRALGAAKPHAHYLVGVDAFAQLAWEAAVPRPLREALLGAGMERVAKPAPGESA